ncbi:tripartite tricarboxylate transporter substrate-binding protein [Mesorhizobium sp. CAU 1741]|uniref:Bug family tripartite tricarboxylate transporter substrate binding protein n=1 Tax=Mesorhizobium sp. CAU 1741 TaxID=3140366 RepID=UPI00325B19BC
MKYLMTAALAAVILAGPAAAQDYPSKAVTIVVPYSPSGSADPVARFIAGELQEKWGQPVVIENRPGAGATIGTAYVATAPADGYTIMLTTSAYTTAPAVYDDLPYDPINDLKAVALPATSQFVVTAGPEFEADSLSELMEIADDREYFLATAGLGSSTHFAGELLSAAIGLNAVPVHYPGGSDAMVDLMGGRADIYVGSATAVLGNVKGGQIKALGVFGAERADALPDVASTEELGIKGASSGFWLGVFAPGETSDEIVEKINADMIEVLSTEEGKAFLATLDSTLSTMSPAEVSELVAAEIDQWKVLAADRGIKAE